MTDVRSRLDDVWERLRKVGIVDDLAIVEYIAALLIEDKPWSFDDKDQKPTKSEVRGDSPDNTLKSLLEKAASEINRNNPAQDTADLLNRHVLFYSSKYLGRGVYPTPRHIVDFMMDLLQVKPEHDFADFACGSGGFLVRRYLQARLSGSEKVSVSWGCTVGVELAHEWTRLAHANLLLHGISKRQVDIYTGNILRLCGTDPLASMLFDRIALSPPLDILIQSPVQGLSLALPRWNPATLDSASLFTYLMYSKLKQDAQGICLVSTSTVSRHSRSAQTLREFVIGAKAVKAVIELNSNALSPFTAERAYILMLHKQVQPSIWFLRIERDGYGAGLYRDLMQEPSSIPENDLPFIQQIINPTTDMPEERSGDITYRRIVCQNKFVGILIKAEENARITSIVQDNRSSQLVIHLKQNDKNNVKTEHITLPIQTASSQEVFQGGTPGQHLAISYDGRLLGVTVSVEELIQHKYDLLPATYLRRHWPDPKASKSVPRTSKIRKATTVDNGPAIGHAKKVPSQEEKAASSQETITPDPSISQLPPIIDLPNIEPILGAKQLTIWRAIKEQYSTEQYALHFTASQLTNTLPDQYRQHVVATLRLLERFGLIVCVQMNEETYDYYRLVTKGDLKDDPKDDPPRKKRRSASRRNKQ
jgi:type I restriction enzyme M protein